MRDDLALLETIREAPNDDVPRLIYADWLEENGDADRAEFIRVQIELTNMPDNDPRRRDFSERERQLLNNNYHKWVKPFADVGVPTTTYSRGLIESLAINAETFLRLKPEVFANNAILHLRLCSWPETENRVHRLSESVAASPNLRWITSLEIMSSTWGRAIVTPLTESRYLTGLLCLDLGGTNIGVRGALHLARSQAFSSLTELRVWRCQIGNQGAIHLAESRGFPQLKSIDLWGNGIQYEGIIGLTQAPWLGTLRELSLSDNPLGSRGVGRLAHAPELRQLTTLKIWGVEADDQAAVALATEPNLVTLRYLKLNNNAIGIAGAQALAASQYLEKLERLEIMKNKIGVAGRRALRSRFGNHVLISE